MTNGTISASMPKAMKRASKYVNTSPKRCTTGGCAGGVVGDCTGGIGRPCARIAAVSPFGGGPPVGFIALLGRPRRAVRILYGAHAQGERTGLQGRQLRNLRAGLPTVVLQAAVADAARRVFVSGEVLRSGDRNAGRERPAAHVRAVL